MKRLSLLLCLAAGPLPLLGQTAVLRAQMDRDSPQANAAPATLCIVDAKGSRALYDGFTSLLEQEDLRAFQVPLRPYTLGNGSEKELLATHRLPAKAQWVLVDRRGAAVARGDQLPDATGLVKELENAGFRDLAKACRAYLKANPQVLEAREQLIAQLRQRGERTAQRHMGVQVPAPREKLDRGDLAGYQREQLAPSKPDLSQAKPLEPAQDLDAWGAFAQELDTVFRTGQWREMDFTWLREGRPLDVASPTLRAVYQRWIPTVEAALRRQPESEPFWDLWLWMNEAQGGARLPTLLASLRPTPLTSKADWPPDRVARALLRSARTPADWRALKELFLTRWDQVPHTLRETSPSNAVADQVPGHDSQTVLLDEDWTAALEPLLESCLRAGDSGQAEALFTEALGASHWRALPAKGADLARRCGRPDLAARWGALRTSGL